MLTEKSPADTTETRRDYTPDATRTRSGLRLLVGADGRTRQAKRWRELFDQYMAATEGKHDALVRSLVTLIIARERLDAEVAAGKPVDVDLLLRLSSEVRRTMTRLGLADADEDGEGEDATEQAIEAARRHIRGEAA